MKLYSIEQITNILKNEEKLLREETKSWAEQENYSMAISCRSAATFLHNFCIRAEEIFSAGATEGGDKDGK